MRYLTAALSALFFAAFFSPAANAQMTTCNAVGNTMNCMTYGNNGNADNSGPSAAEGIGNLIASIGEKNFKKKIGRMLADGDCQGAIRYAYEKGRLELAESIKRSCGQPQAYQAQNTLPGVLNQIATNIRTPIAVDERTKITSVDAVGTQLLMMATIDDDMTQLPTALDQQLMKQFCTDEDLVPLYQYGASVRTIYHNRSGAEIGTILATKSRCMI